MRSRRGPDDVESVVGRGHFDGNRGQESFPKAEGESRFLERGGGRHKLDKGDGHERTRLLESTGRQGGRWSEKEKRRPGSTPEAVSHETKNRWRES